MVHRCLCRTLSIGLVAIVPQVARAEPASAKAPARAETPTSAKAPANEDAETTVSQFIKSRLDLLNYPGFDIANNARNDLFSLGERICVPVFKQIENSDPEVRFYLHNLLASVGRQPGASQTAKRLAREAMLKGVDDKHSDAVRAYCLEELLFFDAQSALAHAERMTDNDGPQTRATARRILRERTENARQSLGL